MSVLKRRGVVLRAQSRVQIHPAMVRPHQTEVDGEIRAVHQHPAVKRSR